MDRDTGQRLVLAGLGAAAGGCLYLLSEVFARDLLSDRLALALTAFAAAYFLALLALTGPLRLMQANAAALGVAVPVAGLLTWASLRYAAMPDLFERPAPVLAAVLLGLLPLPFVIAANGPGWRDYPALFSASWTIVVRFAAAWLFVGVVWALILLSDKVLGIVGVTVIQDLLKLDAVPWLICGTTLGLALAVVTEMADLVSPYLILRLLRLLLPAVLVVMLVFIAALPFRGLSGLFGELSAAGTLLAMALVAATLVTTAIDQSDAEASQGPAMRRAAQGLALILPLPSGLALYAVGLRVAQYG
ncbi:conserved hypothetical protein, partial [Rhodobacter ferrooxidans]